MIFIRQITKDILDDGRVKFWKIDKKSGKWKEVDFRTVQDKVSHALRDSKSTMGPSEEIASTHGSDPYSRKTSTASQSTDLALEPRRTSINLIQDMKQHHFEDSREVAKSDFQQQELNLRLSNMAAASATSRAALGYLPGSNERLPPLLGDLRANIHSGHLPASSLLSSEPLNQSNTLSQQLTRDDILLHDLRRRQASLSSLQLPAPSATPSLIPYQNQRVHASNVLKKNLDPRLGDPRLGDMLSGSNYLEHALQKLSSQREAQIQQLEDILRNTQN